MRLPILSLGHKILKERCDDIGPDYPGLGQLIADLWETMQNAGGCGLAAPQVGHPARLFIVDSQSTYDALDEPERKTYYGADDHGIIEVFINARIIGRSENCWEDDEGCLSIPGLSRPVVRPWAITIEYYNADFERQVRVFHGTTARMIQHEYDHTDGILYIDRLSPLTRKMMKSKLSKITDGHTKPDYPMKFVKDFKH